MLWEVILPYLASENPIGISIKGRFAVSGDNLVDADLLFLKRVPIP
jgi:hypothetical protein